MMRERGLLKRTPSSTLTAEPGLSVSLLSKRSKMFKAFLVLLVILHAGSSFRGVFVPKWQGSSTLKMSTTPDHKLEIFARDMELTPAMQSRVNDKIKKVIDKLGYEALSTHVVLRVVKYSDTGKDHNKKEHNPVSHHLKM